MLRAMTIEAPTIGDALRTWRRRRRLSQLDLSLDAGISQRHLSFVESGRARPSRDMVLLLAEQLAVPLRERNALLLAAGFAPAFRERRLDDPALAPARAAIQQVLERHEPYPALAFDRHWQMVMANAAVAPLLVGIDAALLTPPVNLMRIALHPAGLAPRIVNLGEWRAEILHRLRRQVHASSDPVLTALLAELEAYPGPRITNAEPSGIAATLRLATPAGTLSFITTTMVFGTPSEVTLAELAVEAFWPADDATAAALRSQAAP
jgi:transcriptional regulator with XRE-family HTH domain